MCEALHLISVGTFWRRAPPPRLGVVFEFPEERLCWPPGSAPDAYGRAFGFERMMDTLGAIVGSDHGPVAASADFAQLSAGFGVTIVPGILAELSFGLLVREKPITHPRHSFLVSVRQLPSSFPKIPSRSRNLWSRRFLAYLANPVCHAGVDSVAWESGIGQHCGWTLSYPRHLYAAFAYVGGWLSDHVRQRQLSSLVGTGSRSRWRSFWCRARRASRCWRRFSCSLECSLEWKKKMLLPQNWSAGAARHGFRNARGGRRRR